MEEKTENEVQIPSEIEEKQLDQSITKILVEKLDFY
jgi:hypothetical protein